MSARRFGAGAAAVATLLAACSAAVTPEPSSTTASAVASAVPSASSAASPSSAASSSPVETPGAWPQAGLPYGGAEILEAMRSSRRPGGVPEAVATAPVAEAVAQQLWTIDGTAWDTLAASATCTSSGVCRLELAGTHRGSLGEDVWIFSVDPATPTVQIVDTTLGSVPQAVAAALDALARSLIDLDGLQLTSARWTPPPDDRLFELSYRDAGEEGGCVVELVLDVSGGEVVDHQRSGC